MWISIFKLCLHHFCVCKCHVFMNTKPRNPLWKIIKIYKWCLTPREINDFHFLFLQLTHALKATLVVSWVGDWNSSRRTKSSGKRTSWRASVCDAPVCKPNENKMHLRLTVGLRRTMRWIVFHTQSASFTATFPCKRFWSPGCSRSFCVIVQRKKNALQGAGESHLVV